MTNTNNPRTVNGRSHFSQKERHPARICVGCLYRVGFGCLTISKITRKNRSLVNRWRKQMGFPKQKSRPFKLVKMRRFRVKAPNPNKFMMAEYRAESTFQNRLDRIWEKHPMVMVHIHEARRERCRKRDNHRLRNDPIFRAKHYARKRLREYCKKHGIFKGFSASVELGCNSATFKAWIESKFTGRMGWHNHGEVWELDHIMPLATAATSDEVKRLCHYTNLQPLSVLDNRSKSDSVDRLNLFASQPIPIGCI